MKKHIIGERNIVKDIDKECIYAYRNRHNFVFEQNDIRCERAIFDSIFNQLCGVIDYMREEENERDKVVNKAYREFLYC